MGYRGGITTSALFLLLAACGTTPDGATTQSGGTATCKTPSFEVNIINLPSGVSPTMLSIAVVDDKGKKQTIKGQSVGTSATAWFSGAAALGRKYKAQLYVNGSAYGSAISVPYVTAHCGYSVTYDADTGQPFTGP